MVRKAVLLKAFVPKVLRVIILDPFRKSALVTLVSPETPLRVTLPPAPKVPETVAFPETVNPVNVAPAPVKVVVEAVPIVPLVVMVFPVEIVPKPEAILPDARAPTVVSDDVVTPVPKVVPERTLAPLI